jgi:hypothetical protein
MTIRQAAINDFLNMQGTILTIDVIDYQKLTQSLF